MDDEPKRPELILGVLTDPGRPTYLATKAAAHLSEILSRHLDPAVHWTVQTRRRTIPLDEEDDVVKLHLSVKRERERQGWDLAVYVTDLPRFAEDQIVVADIDTRDSVALISLPALDSGRVRMLRRTLVEVIGLIHHDGDGSRIGRGEHVRRFSPLRGSTASERPGIDSYITVKEPFGSARLLTGMVLGNQPWRLVGNLSGAMFAAAATGTFGVFYASIAELADAAGPIRLTVISVVILALITPWYILHHDLWQPPPRGPRRLGVLYNASSLITILFGVCSLYLVLFVYFTLLTVLVLPSTYLEQQIGHAASVGSYVHLAWLSASMGMIIGAIGTSFDSDERVRAALYSQREANRRKNLDEVVEEQDDDSEVARRGDEE